MNRSTSRLRRFTSFCNVAVCSIKSAKLMKNHVKQQCRSTTWSCVLTLLRACHTKGFVYGQIFGRCKGLFCVLIRWDPTNIVFSFAVVSQMMIFLSVNNPLLCLDKLCVVICCVSNLLHIGLLKLFIKKFQCVFTFCRSYIGWCKVLVIWKHRSFSYKHYTKSNCVECEG